MQYECKKYPDCRNINKTGSKGLVRRSKYLSVQTCGLYQTRMVVTKRLRPGQEIRYEPHTPCFISVQQAVENKLLQLID